MNDETRSPLKSPVWLLLTLTLPMILLFLLWGKDLFIVRESFTPENLAAFLPFFSLLAGYGAGGTLTVIILRYKKRDFGIASAVSLLAVNILLMLIFSVNYHKMLPDVEDFILPVQRWIIYVFTFLMPSAAHSVMILADSFRGKKAIIYSSVAVVVIPLVLFLCAHFLSTLSKFTQKIENLLVIGFSSLLLILGVLFFLAVVKGLLLLIPLVMNWKHGRYLFPLIIGLILPVCGLCLNTYIPFPCDLRSPWPYICSLLNAIVLWLPVAGNKKADLLSIYLKGAVYWFPLYFFLLFLPWLPLFAPAILACGAGFLILTPTLLFLLQNYFYTLDYRKMTLPRKQILIAFFAGVLTVPILFFGKAWSDKADLEQMVSTYYNTSYTMSLEEQKNTLDMPRLESTMTRLIDARDGVELPFLGELYNAIVFNGLTVSDSQLFRMYSDLFGSSPNRTRTVFGVGRDRPRFRPVPLAGLQDRKTTAFVKVTSASFQPSSDGASMELKLKGLATNGEYAGRLKLPEGVFVSGLSLEINGKLERGSVAERKTALWIYEKITNVRKDPALIYYSGADELRFFVFPVTSTRRVVVDFLYPAGTSPEIELDGKKYKLPVRAGDSGAKLLSQSDLESRIVKRTPEIILIVDRSSRKDFRNVALNLRIALQQQFPEAKQVRIVSGIISADNLGKAYPISDLGKAFEEFTEKYQPGTPGFAVSNVVKGAILQSGKLEKDHYPVFVLWTDRVLHKGWDLRGFEEFAPEYPMLIRFSPENKAFAYRFSDMQVVPVSSEPARVARLDDGRVVRVDSGAVTGKGSGKYASALELRADSLKLLRDPSLEKTLWVPLVKRSIEEEILISQTSWIVLETEAQRKTLIEMQRKKLNSPSALDIENTDPREVVRTDAPEMILVLLTLLVLLCVGIYRNRPWLQRIFRRVRSE